MRAFAFDVGDEADAAGIVFVAGVIQPLCGRRGRQWSRGGADVRHAKILREKRGNKMQCDIFARNADLCIDSRAKKAIGHGNDCYRECRAALMGSWPRRVSTNRALVWSAQHADTERQFLERSMIAPHFARCNIFVLRTVMCRNEPARIVGCGDNELGVRLW